jgi:signal transduction histidine kinase
MLKWRRGEDAGSTRRRWLPRTFEGKTIRVVTWAGIIAVSALWILNIFYLVLRVNTLQENAREVGNRYMEQEEALSRIESSVFMSSIFLRDAIIDRDPRTGTEYRQQLESAHSNADEAVAIYRAVAPDARSAAQFADLERQLADYWAEVTLALESALPTTAQQSAEVLRRRVIPRRVDILRISDGIRTLNRQAFQVVLRSRVAALYDEVYRVAWATGALSLLLTVVVASSVVRHAGRLERQTREQMARDAETAKVLQRLSSSLVQAQEHERRTIARELHDEIGQALTAIKVELAVARRSLSEGPATESLDEVRRISDQALRTVRDLSHLLHPTVLDDLGLVAALDQMLAGFSRRSGLVVRFEHEGVASKLSEERAVAVYRIVQEGLTNIVRHADARHVRVRLRQANDRLAVTVEDDGRGFDTAALDGPSSTRGLGLIGIEERARGLGGTFVVESAHWRGSKLSVEIPIGRPAEANERVGLGPTTTREATEWTS